MVSEPTRCDYQMVDRYRDEELDPEERQRVHAHIEGCSHCRKHLEKSQRLGEALTSHLAAGLGDKTAADLADATLRRIREQPAPFLQRMADLFVAKKLWFPATATAFVLMAVVFTSRFATSPEQAPSAIIHSFRSDTASVMIMETREKRQTVIWFTEES